MKFIDEKFVLISFLIVAHLGVPEYQKIYLSNKVSGTETQLFVTNAD